MYKDFHQFFLRVGILAVCAVAVVVRSEAAPPPLSVSDGLEQREQRFSHLTFIWKLDANQHNNGLTAENLQKAREGMKKMLFADYSKRLTDKAQIRASVQEALQSYVKSLSPGSVSYSNVWRFERDGQATQAFGTVQSITDIVVSYRQYYNGSAALRACDDSHLLHGRQLTLAGPIVWQTLGDSVRHNAVVLNDLGLTPEHFVMLAGFNPLAMHDAQWRLTSETPSAWALETRYNEQGTSFAAKVILDRAHDGAPSLIELKQGGSSETLHVLSFRNYQGSWIADKVEYDRVLPKLSTQHQSWSLQSLKPSQPIEVKLTQDLPVHDYRLLGQGLNWRLLNRFEMDQNHSIVTYQWTGKFPTIEQLRKLNSEQYPGEATPDPNRSASLPLLGGIMALVGGVWMFKRRGNGPA